MTDDEKRGKLILELRKKKGLTQKEVGELIHYTDKNISKWENGKSFPNNPNVINQLAEIFEVSVEELMYGELKTKENEEEIKKHFVKQFRDNYNKYKKNINIITFVFLTCIIFALLGIYVTFIKNSVSVYSVEVEGEKIKRTNSTLLLTNKINILSFNKLVLADDKKIVNVSFYYVDDENKKIEIFSGENTNYFIEERVGYEEYYLNKLNSDNTYLEIQYENSDNKVILNVNVKRRYTNDNIFPKNSEDLLNSNSNSKDSKVITKLESFGFKKNSSSYEKQINSNTIITINVKTMNFIVTINGDDIIEQLHINNSNNSIVYECTKNGRIISTNKVDVIGEKNCGKEKCNNIEDYAMYLNFLVKELL